MQKHLLTNYIKIKAVKTKRQMTEWERTFALSKNQQLLLYLDFEKLLQINWKMAIPTKNWKYI